MSACTCFLSTTAIGEPSKRLKLDSSFILHTRDTREHQRISSGTCFSRAARRIAFRNMCCHVGEALDGIKKRWDPIIILWKEACGVMPYLIARSMKLGALLIRAKNHLWRLLNYLRTYRRKFARLESIENTAYAFWQWPHSSNAHAALSASEKHTHFKWDK
jgi:hypothetical protein